MPLFESPTGVGRFDIDLEVNQVVITHRIWLRDPRNELNNENFIAFVDRFRLLIQEHWQGKYAFRRGEATLTPSFRIEHITNEANAGAAHYAINLGRGNQAASVSRQAAFGFAGPNAPKSANFFEPDLAPAPTHALVAADLPTLFPYYVNTYNGGITRFTRETLKRYASQVVALRPNARVAVTGYGANKDGASQQVAATCREAGLTAHTRKSKAFLSTKMSPRSNSQNFVKIELANQLRPALFENTPLFSYPATVVHEFGHMLGLQDEYACLSQTGANALVAADFIEATEEASYRENHNSSARTESPGASNGQAEFIRMCHDAGVEPASFGRHTSSVMSAGAEFLPCHFVTIWQALRDNTGDDWGIVRQ